MFVIREAVTESGVKEPFIVPWTRNITTENGGVTLWRVGDSVMNVETGLPVLKFVVIGRGIWRLTGSFKDSDSSDGSIFWTSDNIQFFSTTAGKDNVVIWNKQDSDSMDRVKDVPLNQVTIPATVSAALARERNQSNPPRINLGFDVSLVDPGVARIYPASNRYASLSDVKGVPADSSPGGLGLAGEQVSNQFESYVTPSEDGGLGLSDGTRPPGLPSQYSNPQSLGQYNQVQQVTTGWWPFRSTNDQSKQTEYFYVERQDPGYGGAITRKVVYKDENNHWKEESATGFLNKLDKLQNNASTDKQAALEARSKQLSTDAAAQFKNVDKAAGSFVDRGFVGHMTDVSVAGAKGSLGPALKSLEGLDKTGKVAITVNATIAGEVLKTAATKKPSAEKFLVNGGLGVATDIGNALSPVPGVAPGVVGALKVGEKIAEGDTDGAIRQGVSSTIDVTKSVATSVVPLDPISGAAVGVGVEGGKKVIEGGLLIQQLGSAANKFDASSEAAAQSLQMRNDRDFAAGAGDKLRQTMFDQK